MTLRLTRLDANMPIANTDGTPTLQFLRLYNGQLQQIETEVGALTIAQAAQTSATASARELARINSYPNPTNVLSAADVGADATITVATHTRVYPVQGSIDVADLSITGSDITGKAFSTQYSVFYDDVLLTDATPTFQAVETATSHATAQPGAAAGRHFVGVITTPANGAGGTSGTGGGPPGGGGGTVLP